MLSMLPVLPLLLLTAAAPTAIREGARLTATWTGERQQALRLQLNLAEPEKLIAELSVAGHVLLRDAAPAYSVYTGKRRGGWDNFFDTPSSRPHETREFTSTLRTTQVKTETLGQRLRITAGPLSLGIFQGDLVFTLYDGSNLIHQEAVVRTDEPDTAYYYNAWLTRVSTNELDRLHWLDAATGQFREHRLTSDLDLDFVPLKVHRRALIANGRAGSLALFPPPHQYFPARDLTINYGNLWYRLYRINPDVAQGDFFSFGIRQTAFYEQEHWVPLVNAPPGTEQRLSLFWYASPDNARDTFGRVSAYTHGDRYPRLEGYQRFSAHYHLSMTMDARRRGLSPDYRPEFVDVFRDTGIDIAHVYDFHTDGHPRNTGAVRAAELRDYYAEARRLSSGDFLLIPGEEANAHFGGHWNLLLPGPLTWFMQRKAAEPFEENGVYRVGSAEEMFRMIQRTGALAFTAHPRTKGSTGYPDNYKDTAFYRDASFLGGGFKAMPSDNASPRLGERSLKLLDDMNNWGQRKFLVGEVDVFKIDRSHEVWGHMNINYVKLPAVPKFPDWSPLLAALKAGDFFVSTGEVLLHGVTLRLEGGRVVGEADVAWTFPLRMLEVVWGDGRQTHRTMVELDSTGQFGRRKFDLAAPAPGAKWARFAVWDVAANGAFTQPVWF